MRSSVQCVSGLACELVRVGAKGEEVLDGVELMSASGCLKRRPGFALTCHVGHGSILEYLAKWKRHY